MISQADKRCRDLPAPLCGNSALLFPGTLAPQPTGGTEGPKSCDFHMMGS